MARPDGFSENALRILKARYLLRDEQGKFLDKSPADLFKRVADFIASAESTKKDRERWAKKFYDVMMARDFLPNSPTLTGAGRQMCLLDSQGTPMRVPCISRTSRCGMSGTLAGGPCRRLGTIIPCLKSPGRWVCRYGGWRARGGSRHPVWRS